MEYVALKYTRFGGLDFKVGETIPEELVDPAAAETLKKAHVIVVKGSEDAPTAQEAEPALSTITINVHAEEGDLALDLTQEGLQAFVDVITAKAADAETIIETMTDSDALILLDIADSRKSIKQAAKERALALNLSEAGEQ